MPRLAVVVCLLAFSFGLRSIAQTSPSSDPLAISLAQQSVVALTQKLPIGDVTLNANVVSIYGSDNETGTGTFKAKGFAESRVDLNLSGGTRSDVRMASGGGAWKANAAAAKPYAGHNCQTDASWFFPALSSLSQIGNPNFIFKYVGQEQHASVNTQHIRVFEIFNNDPAGLFQRLSTEDFYLDVNTGLPDALVFNSHPDSDLNTNIATEIRFANYQSLSGVLIPFHFQQILNGSVVLDATVTGAAVNSRLADALFNLQ